MIDYYDFLDVILEETYLQEKSNGSGTPKKVKEYMALHAINKQDLIGADNFLRDEGMIMENPSGVGAILTYKGKIFRQSGMYKSKNGMDQIKKAARIAEIVLITFGAVAAGIYAVYQIKAAMNGCNCP